MGSDQLTRRDEQRLSVSSLLRTYFPKQKFKHWVMKMLGSQAVWDRELYQSHSS